MMTQEEVDDLLGAAQSSPLVLSGQLLVLVAQDHVVFPAFQFDLPARRVRPAVAEVNVQLGARSDPWGVASWWLSPSGSLPEGESPSDLVVRQDAEGLAMVSRLANDLVER